MLSPLGFLREKELKTADALISALRLSDDNWADQPDQKAWERGWLFRGQGNSDFPLIPSAWRPQNQEFLRGILGRNPYTTLRILVEQNVDMERPGLQASVLRITEPEDLERLADVICNAYMEYRAVEEFILAADAQGHATPGIYDLLASKEDFITRYIRGLLQLDGDLSDMWVKREIAFAQHYGIPTRLLDWTENPLAAAFFAAEDAVKHEISLQKRLVVYAIHRVGLWSTGNGIRRVPVAQHENPYLRAQKGVLIADLSADAHYIKTGSYPDLLRSFSRSRSFPELSFTPKAFTLPTSEAPNLLRLLAIEGVTKASLMPTLGNVSETLKLKWKYIADN